MSKLNTSKSEFLCLDSYEAEKVSGIFSKQKDNTLFASEIVKIIGSEVVIRLNDGSHHSILLKDEDNAFQLSVFFKNLKEINGNILETIFNDNRVIIHWNHH